MCMKLSYRIYENHLLQLTDALAMDADYWNALDSGVVPHNDGNTMTLTDVITQSTLARERIFLDLSNTDRLLRKHDSDDDD